MPKIYLLRQELQLQHEELRGLIKEAPPSLPPPQDTLSSWELLSEPNYTSDNKTELTALFEEKIELQINTETKRTGKSEQKSTKKQNLQTDILGETT